MVAISITVQSLAAGLSDKLQSGDIIRLYHYNDLSGTLNVVQDIPELKFVKVLSVSDSKGLDIDYTKQPEEDEEKLQTATLWIQATPEQAMLLTQYENEGMLHVALISRGNEALAKDLLNQQAEILTQLYENEDADAELNAPEETTGETTEESSAASEETTPETEPEQNRR